MEANDEQPHYSTWLGWTDWKRSHEDAGRKGRSKATEKIGMGGFTALAIRSNSSMEIIFSPRSISSRYFGFKLTFFASFS